MDLFNAKALAASESRSAALERELEQRNNDIALLRQALRSMDEIVVKLQQTANSHNSSPEIGRTIGKLVELTEHRRKTESDRINAIIYTELAR